MLGRAGEFKGQSICCVVSGGNVDRSTYGEILLG
jgi:threonine dehydratase